MNREEHLLTILSEECAEVAQRASKIQRFGMTETEPGQALSNDERLFAEFCDLMGVYEMVGKFPSLNSVYARNLMQEKKEKVEKYLRYSKQVGRLE